MISKRRLAIAVAVLVVALVTVLVVRRRRSGPVPLRLVVEVAPLATRGVVPATTCVLGSDVTVRASGASAIWLYREDVLIASCPGEAACRDTAAGLELTFRPAVATRHHIIAVAGPRDLTSTQQFDRDTLRARTRGARLELSVLDVVAPR